jgi:hypothetical protein
MFQPHDVAAPQRVPSTQNFASAADADRAERERDRGASFGRVGGSGTREVVVGRGNGTVDVRIEAVANAQTNKKVAMMRNFTGEKFQN